MFDQQFLRVATTSSHRMDAWLAQPWQCGFLLDARLAAFKNDVPFLWSYVFRTIPHCQPLPAVQAAGVTGQMAVLGHP